MKRHSNIEKIEDGPTSFPPTTTTDRENPTPSTFLNDLFLKDSTGLEIDELDDSDIRILANLSGMYVLYSADLKALNELWLQEILDKIETLSNDSFRDAIKGLGLLVTREKNIKSLSDFDELLERKRKELLKKLPPQFPSSRHPDVTPLYHSDR